MTATPALLEIVLPVYNEAQTIPVLIEHLDRAAAELKGRAAVSYLFIDDGSTDGTSALLDTLHSQRSDIRVVHFVRNFGHNAALACGLETFRGDVAIFMDADLQDDPRSVVSLFQAWEEGSRTVVIERGARPESAGILFKAFYFLLRRTARRLPPLNYGTHCLLDRTVVERLRLFPEKNRYFPGLVGMVSGDIKAIRMDRGERLHGKSRVGLGGLLHLAVTALVSFSATPVRLVSWIGLACSFGAFASASVIIGVKIFTPYAIPGWASIMTVTLFASGLQSLCLGILGEYVARMYEEVKGRPLFLVDRTLERRSPAFPTRLAETRLVATDLR